MDRRRELQSEISYLVHAKSQIFNNLRRGGGVPAIPHDRGKKWDSKPDESRGVKRPRQTVTFDQRGRVIEEDTVIRERMGFERPRETEFRVEKRPKVELDAKTASRSRNLMGVLVGHLKKAKDRIDFEAGSRQAELQRQRDLEVTKMVERERRNLEELRKRDDEERRARDHQRIRDLENLIAQKENQLLRFNLEDHYRRMTRFIRTRTEPTVFWLPIIHTDGTRKLQEETRLQIEQKVRSLKTQFADDLPASTAFEVGAPSPSQAGKKVEVEDDATKAPQKAAVHPDLLGDEEDEDEEEEETMGGGGGLHRAGAAITMGQSLVIRVTKREGEEKEKEEEEEEMEDVDAGAAGHSRANNGRLTGIKRRRVEKEENEDEEEEEADESQRGGGNQQMEEEEKAAIVNGEVDAKPEGDLLEDRNSALMLLTPNGKAEGEEHEHTVK